MKNILLVDDERSLLLSMAEGLEAYVREFKVHTAMNGREALEIFDSHPVDLVVTDLRMPEMEGFELLDWMRERHPEVPAIVLSAFVTPRIKDKLKEMGASEVLAKPLDFRKLAASILAALEGRDKGSGSGESALAQRLRALEAEKGTALMEVEHGGQSGHILVVNGEVMDAVLGKTQGDEAVLAILRWPDPVVRAKPAPARNMRQKIYADVATLLRRAEAGAPRAQSPEAAAVDLLSDSDLAFLESLEEEEILPKAVPLPEPEAAPLPKPKAKAAPPPPPRPQPPPPREPGMSLEKAWVLTEVLEAMSEELEHVKLLALSGPGGTSLATHGPWAQDRPGVENGFFKVLDAAQAAASEGRAGELEEVVIQASSAWVLVRQAGSARLVVAVGRESTLGNVRLVAARYARTLAFKIAAD
ncbi:MAG: response regulator [Proteobacteria bacterium]|nr:response regulator [Pseudomonadota bacterium]